MSKIVVTKIGNVIKNKTVGKGEIPAVVNIPYVNKTVPKPSVVVDKKKDVIVYPHGTLSSSIVDVDAAVKYLTGLTSIQDVLAFSDGDGRTEIAIVKKTFGINEKTKKNGGNNKANRKDGLGK